MTTSRKTKRKAPSSLVTRRVVITGLGLVCGVGNTAPEVWRQLLAGASGMAPIQGFDTTGFPVTFAAEVKNFDPLQFVDKKEARKMGRFTHFAFAATQEAMAQAGLKSPRKLGTGWAFLSAPASAVLK